MNRLKHLTTVAATLGMLGSLSACSSTPPEAKSGTDAVFTSIPRDNPITTGAPMNPFNASGNTFAGYDTMHLGWDKKNPLNSSDFFPGLAATWKSGPASLTVELQPNAKWSDGKPVTADDIGVSLAIALTQGNATVGAGVLTQGLDVASVKSLGPHTVEIGEVAGANNLQFVPLVLSQPIVAASVYGAMLPSDIWKTIAASQDPAPSAATSATAAVDKLNALGQKVSAFAPAKDVSAGPFVVTRINPGAVVLDRNKYFYDLAKISPKQVVLRNFSGNAQIWGYMTNGELDAAPFTSTPTNVLKRILAAGYKQVDGVNYVNASIAFNQSVAPYNDRAVRQALAYIIDRKAVTKVGEPVGGTASSTTSGLIGAAARQWLTPEQLSGLTAYDPDQAKATQLLKGAGLTKSGNQWILPDGKPWTITLQAVSGFSDWIAGSTVIASELTDFGIPTKPAITADFATYKKEMAAGKYAVGWWLTALSNRPSSAFQRLYGADDGYTAIGANVKHASGVAAGNWQNGPTSFTVKGQSLDPGALTAKLSILAPADQKPIVQQLALATNQEMPVVQIWDYTNVQFVSEKRFTNFPKSGQNGLLSNSAGVWMMQGYVQGK